VIAQPNGQGGVLAPTSGTQGGVGGPAASPPGGSPKRQQRQVNPNTFAGMQQQGMARPSASMVRQNPYAMQGVNPGLQQQTAQMAAPGSAQPSSQGSLQAAQQSVSNAQAGRSLGTYQTNANAQALGGPLMDQVMQLLQDPTQGLNDAAASNFDRQNRTLGREFDTLRGNLNEQMAASGLDASTIRSGKLGELGARQAEAQADVSARIQEQLIRDRSSAMNSAITAAMGFRGQEADMGKDEYVVNRDTGELEFQRGVTNAKLGMDGQRLSLDTELGRGNLAVSQGQLGLGQQRLGFDQSRDTRDFAYQQDRDAVGDTRYDERFAYDKGVDTRNFDYRAGRDVIGDGQWNKQFDYGVSRDTKNDQYRDRRDVYSDGRDTKNDEYRDRRDVYSDGRDTKNDQYRDKVYDYGVTRDNKNDTYRDGRDKVTDNQWDKSYNQNDKNITTQGFMSLLNGMGYKNIPPAMLASIMQSLGMPPLPPPASGNSGDSNDDNGGF
jgi:hypothetical protein